MAITNTQVAIYSSDGTTLTKLAQTAPAASGLWDTATTAFRTTLADTTQVLVPGTDYYVALFVNAGTGGSHTGFAKAANTVALTTAEMNPPPMYTKTSETAVAATYTIASLTAAYDLVPEVWVTTS